MVFSTTALLPGVFRETENVVHKKEAGRLTLRTPNAIANLSQQMENKNCFYLNRVLSSSRRTSKISGSFLI
jgi:hypothetical protein